MTVLIKNGVGLYLNETLNYFMIDSEKSFQENRERFGPSWHWYDREIIYKINELGYRMKNIDEVDFDNYILFLGCSYCFGLGLPVEDTYSYQISKSLNIDYVNAGMCGTGIDLTYYNFIKLIASVDNKTPKYVVVNWPDSARACYWEDDVNNIKESGFSFFLPQYTHNKNSVWVKSYQEFITNQSHIEKRFDFYRSSIKTICDIFNIKYYEFTCTDDPRYSELGIHNYGHGKNTDTGLDPYSLNHSRNLAWSNDHYISHPGPKINEKISEDFLTWVKSN